MIFLLSLILFSFSEMNDAIPDGPFSYSGNAPREIITVDPDNAALLTKASQTLSAKLEEMILQTTLDFVRNTLYDQKKCHVENTRFVIEEAIGSLYGEISLEVFLKEKIGVCRHMALTTTYLLNDLVKYGILKGEVFLLKDNTPSGRHAWTLFLTETNAWHLDAYWEIAEDAKTEKGFAKLCQKYGKQVMERQRSRWEK